MICDSCRLDAGKLYLLYLEENKGIWGCDKCLKLYKRLLEHYSNRSYPRQRIIRIMKGIVTKQKSSGKW